MNVNITNMEIKVYRSQLLEALTKARKVINIGSELMIFKSFVFSFGESSDRTMTVCASNDNEHIEVDCTLCESVKNPRAISVYYTDLIAPIRSLDEQELHIVVSDYQMTVHHSSGSFRLPLTNQAQEYLAVPRREPDSASPDYVIMEYEAPHLKNIIRLCRPAMHHDGLRPALNGIFFNHTKDFSDYVASNGHKLFRVRKSPGYSPLGLNDLTAPSFIMPESVVSVLQAILPPVGDVEIEYQEKKLAVNIKRNKNGTTESQKKVERPAIVRIVIDDRIRLTFNPVDAQYPNYLSVIPGKHNYEISVNRRQLLKSVKRLQLLNTGDEMMKAKVSEDTMELSTEYKDYEISGDERVACECKNTKGKMFGEFKMALKLSPLVDILSTITSENIVMHAVDYNHPLLFYPKPQPDVEEVTMLLMPMLYNDEDE